jgi:hypothetical protein
MRTISGRIISGWDQQPIPGAHLILQLNVDGDYFPLGDGTTTDANGFYSFTFVPGGFDNERILITHIGHEDAQIFPHFVAGSVADVTMQYKFHEVDGITISDYRTNTSFWWFMAFGVIGTLAIVFAQNGTITK